jgi:hypothetical protein
MGLGKVGELFILFSKNSNVRGETHLIAGLYGAGQLDGVSKLLKSSEESKCV